MLNRLKPFYTCAINAELRPIHLLPDSDRCPAGTWEDHIIQTPEEVLTFLEKGDNMGILLAGKGGGHPNPLGIWALMLHSESALDQVADTPFIIRFVQGYSHERILLGRLGGRPAERLTLRYQCPEDQSRRVLHEVVLMRNQTRGIVYEVGLDTTELREKDDLEVIERILSSWRFTTIK